MGGGRGRVPFGGESEPHCAAESVGECGVGSVLCGGLLLVPVRKEGSRGYEQIPGITKELLHCEHCQADCELLAIPTRMAFLFLSRLLLLPLPLFVLLRFYDLM